MSASEDVLSVGSVVSLASGKGRSRQFQDRAAAIRDVEGLYDLVGALAKGLDRVRAEVADNTRAVDAIAHDLKDIKLLLQELVDGQK